MQKRRNLLDGLKIPKDFLVARLGFAQSSSWAPRLEVEDEVARVGEEWKGLPYRLSYL